MLAGQSCARSQRNYYERVSFRPGTVQDQADQIATLIKMRFPDTPDKPGAPAVPAGASAGDPAFRAALAVARKGYGLANEYGGPVSDKFTEQLRDALTTKTPYDWTVKTYMVDVPSGDIARLYGYRGRTPENTFVLDGESVSLDPDRPDNDHEWAFVTFQRGGAAPRTGWMETRYLVKEAAPDRLPVVEAAFVRICARCELLNRTSEEHEAVPVVADYLIALTNVLAPAQARSANPAPDGALGDAEGVYLLTPADWKAYADATGLTFKNDAAAAALRAMTIMQVPAMGLK